MRSGGRSSLGRHGHDGIQRIDHRQRDDTFDCVPDVSGDAGAIGEPCEFINVCDAGLFCAMDGSVPGCEGPGCCAPFCDAAGPDTCEALLPGTVCTPWFEGGMEPGACGSTAIVGACRSPA
jgi:hypothetical protein